MPEVKISFITAGYCTHPEKAVYAKGSWRPRVFPASVAVIEHSTQGVLLFDTGYSERFFAATQKFPAAMYRWLTPVFLDEGNTAKAQLAKGGISERDVRQVILSHFHADHVGAVSDFAQAKYVYQSECYAEVRALAGFSAVRKAFLPSLLPVDFLDRSLPVANDGFLTPPPELAAFDRAKDLYDDGTLWLVQLPGHTNGHIGLFVRTQSQDYLLAGDACYVRENFLQDAPSSFVTRLIFSDFAQYRSTLHRLHDFHRRLPETQIVPCHCAQTLQGLPHFKNEYAERHR